jgi:hypothetical protein
MGEAKRRYRAWQEARTEQFLRELDVLGLPPVDGEADLLVQVLGMTMFEVPRAPMEQLLYMRMKANECHANTRAYAQLDPEQRSRVVLGWWCDTSVPRLHSVIRRDARLVCVTPSPLDTISFRPDPLIETGDDGVYYTFHRRGQRIPSLVRPDPQRTIEAAREARAMIGAGRTPDDLSLELHQALGTALPAWEAEVAMAGAA